MSELGEDLLPKELNKDMPKSLWNQRLYDIPEDGSIIFTKKIRFHYFHEF
jgi:hypothetical protein